MKPYLVVDCYVEHPGGADNFIPRLGDRPFHSVWASTSPCPVDATDYAGLFISGSRASLTEREPWLDRIYALLRSAHEHNVPTLGVCFGHQLLAEVICGAGTVRHAPLGEVGFYDVEITTDDPLFDGFDTEFRTFCTHFDEVTPGTKGLTVLARTPRCPIQAFRVGEKSIWGVQFHCEMQPEETKTLTWARIEAHPELQTTPQQEWTRFVDCNPIGDRLIANFLREVER